MLHERFLVTLQFRNQVRGGTPKNPDTIRAWLKARINDEAAVDTLAAQAVQQMAPPIAPPLSEEQIEKVSEAVWNGFKSYDFLEGRRLCLEGRQVKAMLKESANILRDVVGVAALKSKVAERWFVEEEFLSLGKDQPDGFSEGFVHAMTASGPINALKRVDYLVRPVICFTLRCLIAPFVTRTKEKISNEELLTTILEHASWNGLGAERSQEYGRFDVLSVIRSR